MTYWVTGSFVPFDDTLQPPEKVVQGSAPRTDTRSIDYYRQGIELKTSRHVFGSNQPKIWGGEVDWFGVLHHDQNTNSFGQAVDFTQYEGSHLWHDLPNFSPADYIVSGSDYPLPIYFNGGPAKQQEAIMEVMEIPFRLPSLEGAHPMRSVKGSRDLVVDHFIPLGNSNTYLMTPWLDQGEVVMGDTLSGSIVYPGYVAPEKVINLVFEDTTSQDIMVADLHFQQSVTGSMKALVSTDNRLLPMGKRSACAGYSHYGPNQARYGTDSSAFAGWTRGS